MRKDEIGEIIKMFILSEYPNLGHVGGTVEIQDKKYRWDIELVN